MNPYKTHFHEYVAEMRPELGAELVRQVLKEGHKLPAVLSRPEVMLCVGAAEQSERNRLVVRLFYATGVRLEEMANFVVADIRWDDQVMFVREGKGCKDRFVCVDRESISLLREYTRKMTPQASLFGIGTRQVYRIVIECGQALGLVERYEAIGRRFSPHAFRHSMATHLYENGMDLFSLKKLLGHDYLETTEIYVQVSMAKVRQAYDQAGLFGPTEAPAVTMKLKPNLNLGTQENPDLRHLIQTYRTCHELALQAGPVA